MEYKKEDFTYVLTLNSLAISFGDDSRIITSDDPMFDKLSLLIKKQNWDQLARELLTSAYVKEFFNGELQVINGEVQVSTEDGWKSIPIRLGNTIKTYIAENLPYKPLVRFAQKLLRNPSQNSVDQLFNFIEANNITITDDGSFMVYKKVRKNYLDVHSGTFDNSPGKTPEMPREAVNSDPNVTCSYGLHVASYSYAASGVMGSGDDRILVLCKVSPEDIVSVPVDYQSQKIRCCKYTVVERMETEIKSNYYKTANIEEDFED